MTETAMNNIKKNLWLSGNWLFTEIFILSAPILLVLCFKLSFKTILYICSLYFFLKKLLFLFIFDIGTQILINFFCLSGSLSSFDKQFKILMEVIIYGVYNEWNWLTDKYESWTIFCFVWFVQMMTFILYAPPIICIWCGSQLRWTTNLLKK